MIDAATSFTFVANNGEVPLISIDGKKFHVIFCSYMYSTATDTLPGRLSAIVSGYMDGELKQRSFNLDLYRNVIVEF
jgi:hypothetical protein